MTALISYSQSGREIAERLKEKLEADHFDNKEKSVKEKFKSIWENHKEIIFISAVGIAVRTVAGHLKDKKTDPAVIVVDDKARYVISLLSGHLGGANALAEKIAEILGATPIITTASDSRAFESLDMYIKRMNLYYHDKEKLTRMMRRMVDGEKIKVYSEIDLPNYPNFQKISFDEIDDNSLVISNQKSTFSSLRLGIRDIHLGMGMKRGTTSEALYDFIEEELEKKGLDIKRVKDISSIDIKKDEEGLLKLAKSLDVDLKFYKAEELETAEHLFEGSAFVKKITGAANVSQAALYLTTGLKAKGRIARDGITLAIIEEKDE